MANVSVSTTKSTPIAQLPFSSPSAQPQQQQLSAPPPGYVNDQHRQMVAQAQHAAQAYSMPQASSQDIAQDDDATINDVLGVLQGQHQQQQQQQGLAPPAAYFEQMYGQPSAAMLAAAHAQAQMQAQAQGPPVGGRSLIASLIPFSTDDVRSVIVAVFLFVVVSLIPVGAVVSRYATLEGFPYAHLIFRASLFGVALLAAKKMLSA